MNKTGLLLLPLTLALALAACSQAPDGQAAAPATPSPAAAPAPAPADATPPAPSGPQVEVAQTQLIHAEPAALPDCNGGVVTLTWNVHAAKPELNSVKIYTGSGQLFTHQGGAGTADTGAWVKPGSVFVLKSGEDDSELERLTIGGPVCPAS